MTNFPAVRWFTVVILFFLVGCLRTGTSAQFFPFAPNSPTEARECQSFRTAVEVYVAYYSREHDQCLANNKPDRQQETKDSLICSRSHCQYLHDIVYGDSVFSAEYLEKEVTSCYEAVKENQAEEAQRAQEEATQEAQGEKDETDRAARRQRDRDAQEARHNQIGADQAARERDEERKSTEAQQAESDRTASQQNQETTAPTSSSAAPQATEGTSRSNQNSETSSTLVDPFTHLQSTESQGQEIAANESMVDPFASISNSHQSSSDVANGKQEEAWEGAKGTFEGFVDKAADNIEQTLNEEESELSPEDFEEFKHTADDAHSFLDGLSETITVITFQEEEDSKKVIENPGNHTYHDIISDSVSLGFSYVLKRLSPDFLSPIYEGPAGWLAAITFDSSLTQLLRQHFDYMAALNNPGLYTFQQREAALQSLYQSAQNHPEVWNRARFQWLYAVSESLYNSSDNPNVNLTPPSPPSPPTNPNINLAPH